jgi:hypothetical protein
MVKKRAGERPRQNLKNRAVARRAAMEQTGNMG